MSFGRFLGAGESYYLLPWNALTYDTGKGGSRSRQERTPSSAASIQGSVDASLANVWSPGGAELKKGQRESSVTQQLRYCHILHRDVEVEWRGSVLLALLVNLRLDLRGQSAVLRYRHGFLAEHDPAPS